MGGAKYNPVSQAGYDDAIDPAAAAATQLYKKIKATSKKPVPLNLKALGAGTLAGIAAESTTQNALDAVRGGKPSDNPYVQSLEKLGSRMIGGSTTGAVYGKNPASVLTGAIGGAAVDIGDNLIGIANLTPELIQLYKDKQYTDNMDKIRGNNKKVNSKITPIYELTNNRYRSGRKIK